MEWYLCMQVQGSLLMKNSQTKILQLINLTAGLIIINYALQKCKKYVKHMFT